MCSVCELQNPSMSTFLNGLESSGWMRHIKSIIDASVFVAKVHCHPSCTRCLHMHSLLDCYITHHHHHNHFTALFRYHPGEPVPEENFFWTLWCKGRLTEANTPTIRLGATPSGLTSAHLHHLPIFYRPDALPAAQPTVSKH